MTRLRLLALTCCVLLTVTAGCKGQSVITPEQAMDAVRAFEGSSTLQLTCDPLEEDLEGPEWAHERTYEIYDSQNEERSWTVDAVTGEVTWASYHDARSDTRTESPTGPLTQEQCRQIAEDFARSKYAEFDTMGLQPDEPEWDGDGWSFGWSRKNIYGAWIPNSVHVWVSSSDGRIQTYASSRLPVPMPPPQQPQITPEQAVDIAKAEKGLVTGGSKSPPVLNASPDGTAWAFTVDGRNAQGERLMYRAVVDAVTGEIVELVEPMGGAQTSAPASAKAK